METVRLENKDQAKAFAQFLVHEIMRHIHDIRKAEQDIAHLDMAWGLNFSPHVEWASKYLHKWIDVGGKDEQRSVEKDDPGGIGGNPGNRGHSDDYGTNAPGCGTD